MQKMQSFEAVKISNIESIKGGDTATEGGTKSYKNSSGQTCWFAYDSDCTTWTSGATEWTVCYYGILANGGDSCQ